MKPLGVQDSAGHFSGESAAHLPHVDEVHDSLEADGCDNDDEQPDEQNGQPNTDVAGDQPCDGEPAVIPAFTLHLRQTDVSEDDRRKTPRQRNRPR